jgi:hypothetical protein
MRHLFLFPFIMFGTFGCSGLDIKPISAQQDENAHNGEINLNGYIVYEPVIAVEVSTKDEKCSVGSPFVLGPDYSKPFIINTRSGFGKAGVDVTIQNGWMLSAIKDNSDNTAVLGTIERLAMKEFKSSPPVTAKNKCISEGIYRVILDNSNKVGLQKIEISYH